MLLDRWRKPRLLPLEAEMSRWLDDVWPDLKASQISEVVGRYAPHAHLRDGFITPSTESVERLMRRWSTADVGQMAADMYFAPLTWQKLYRDTEWKLVAMLAALGAAIRVSPPPDIAHRVQDRLKKLLGDPSESAERTHGHLRFSFDYRGRLGWSLHLVPGIGHCLALLVDLPPTPQTLAVTEELVLGSLNAGPFATEEYFVGGRPLKSYEIFSYELVDYLPRMMQRLYEADRLPYERFRDAAHHSPFLLEHASSRTTPYGRPSPFHEKASLAFGDAVIGYCRDLGRDLVENLSDDNSEAVKLLDDLRGPEYLHWAAKHHAAFGLKQLAFDGFKRRRRIDTRSSTSHALVMSSPLFRKFEVGLSPI